MSAFTARKNANGNLTLCFEGSRFGTIFLRGDGTVSGGCFVDEEVTECFNRLRMPIDSTEGALARARRAYEIVNNGETK